MISRCKFCSDIAPDFSDLCDSCAELESVSGIDCNWVQENIFDDFTEDFVEFIEEI
jgi:hypothetical protein